MGGAYKWPPEIDIFEGFSNDGEYNRMKFPKLKNVKIQPNLHYGNVNQNTKDDYGAYDVPVFDATKRFVQYVCHWEKDFIKIYYDGNLIFETKDKDILKWYNNETDKIDCYNRLDYLIFVISQLKNMGMENVSEIKQGLAEFLAQDKPKKEILIQAYLFDIEKADELTVKKVVEPAIEEPDMELDEEYLQELGVGNN
jgi:hypothetical protein